MHQLAWRISLIPVNRREYFIHRVRYVNVTERGAKYSVCQMQFSTPDSNPFTHTYGMGRPKILNENPTLRLLSNLSYLSN